MPKPLYDYKVRYSSEGLRKFQSPSVLQCALTLRSIHERVPLHLHHNATVAAGIEAMTFEWSAQPLHYHGGYDRKNKQSTCVFQVTRHSSRPNHVSTCLHLNFIMSLSQAAPVWWDTSGSYFCTSCTLLIYLSPISVKNTTQDDTIEFRQWMLKIAHNFPAIQNTGTP